MIQRGVLAGSLLGALPLAAQVAPAPPAAQQNPPAAQAAAPDFSAGLQRLAALGLPDLKGAQWIAAGENSYDSNSYHLREIMQDMKGGAWLIKTGDAYQSLGLGKVETTAAQATATTRRRGIVGALFGGTKEEAHKSIDPSADVATLIASLNDPAKGGELQSNFKYYGTAGIEKILIFAAQLQQAGHPEAANKLAAAILQFSPNPEAVIDAAVGSFADRDYSKATQAFFTNRDWKAYDQALAQLLEKYPRGWEVEALVKSLQTKVADRASGKPAPALQGVDLNADARAALEAIFTGEHGGDREAKLKAWAKQNGVKLEDLNEHNREEILGSMEMEDSASGSCWLLESDAKGDTPSSRLARCGMDALPVLLAAMQDETLTLSRNASSRSQSHFSFNESSEEKLTKRYAAMDRPLARKEVARRWLEPVLPGDLDEASDEAIADSAREFIKQYRGKPKLELLLAYLRDGTEPQKGLAANALIVLNDAAADKAFEDFVMGGDFLSTLEHTRNYLKARKGKASGFYERYAKAFRDALADVDLEESSGGYRLKQYGGVEKHLKKLAAIIGSASPRDQLLKLAAAERPDTKAIAECLATAKEASPEKLAGLVAEAADQAKSPQTAYILLYCSLQYASSYSHTAQDKSKAQAPTQSADLWKRLLNNQQKASEPVSPQLTTISSMAAFCVCCHYEADFSGMQSQYYEVLDDDFNKVAHANALALCEGKPTNWPNAEKVKPERMKELIASISKLPAKEVHAKIQAWNPDEKLAWLEYSAEAEDLPANVQEAARLIVIPAHTPESLKQELQQAKLSAGDPYNADAIRKFAAHLAKTSGGSKPISYFFHASLHSGIAVNSSEIDTLRNALQADAREEFDQSPDAELVVIAGGEQDSLVFGANKDGILLELSAERKQQLEQWEKDFREGNAEPYLMITYQRKDLKADPNPSDTSSENGEDEE